MALLRGCAGTAGGERLQALIVVLWRSGRISEALALGERDLDEPARQLQRSCGIRRRIAPHQLRHGHAVELVREGIPVHILQRQLGHANLAATTVYLSSAAPEEVLAVVHSRRPPTVQITSLIRWPHFRICLDGAPCAAGPNRPC